uniref:Uncharacterized protein n=1 Tax=Picea sitchensis TaxID=3332 RepID=A0A6B9XQ24_PICSI|nr:hypothetical protein Q903MT_gene4137 [Picea sitchensis]
MNGLISRPFLDLSLQVQCIHGILIGLCREQMTNNSMHVTMTEERERMTRQ